MKKVLSVILSVLMLAVAGCGQIAAGASSGGEETPVTLNRPEHTSVYGVEAPAATGRRSAARIPRCFPRRLTARCAACGSPI